jgi:hypothetical protein
LTRKRQKTDPLAAMAAANPAPTDGLAAQIEPRDLERALERAVARGREPSRPIPVGDRVAMDTRGRARPRAGRRVTLGFGIAAAVLVALLALGGVLGGDGSGRPQFAAAAIRVAEANPRLLVTAPGWEIVRADEFEPDSGELSFSDGARRFEVRWYPARLYGVYQRDRADVSPPQPGTLLGRHTTTVEYSPEEFATMLPPQGSVFTEVRGRLGSREAYEEILHSLQPVDVDTWLEAMPETTVRPQARSKAVEEMLRGIPLPPGFSAAALAGEDSISDEGSLATKVGNAVACGWVESWIAARGRGDEAAAGRAVQAMEGSPEWPIVSETGIPWFSNYKLVTRQLREGRLDRGYSGYEVRADGRTFGFGPAWKLQLGCGGTYRREVDGLPE